MDGETEIGFCLNKKYEGKGYMTESVKGLLKLAALLGVNRVFAETREDNVKSKKSLKGAVLTLSAAENSKSGERIFNYAS